MDFYSMRATYSDPLTLLDLMAVRTSFDEKHYETLLRNFLQPVCITRFLLGLNILSTHCFKTHSIEIPLFCWRVVPRPFLDSSRNRQTILRMAANILIPNFLWTQCAMYWCVSFGHETHQYMAQALDGSFRIETVDLVFCTHIITCNINSGTLMNFIQEYVSITLSIAEPANFNPQEGHTKR
jgi:hypothetical protein